ncbi:MAG TPA: hypothetical protein PKY82_02070 [Pyrinomonadaceae bacterium]|nr:hypothetical protein [Pyrinomonadaceae bacterium]
MSEETKPKGKAIEIEIDDDFAPDNRDIKDTQKFASEVSPFLLGLLEAEEEK